jgi:hypothetical protein
MGRKLLPALTAVLLSLSTVGAVRAGALSVTGAAPGNFSATLNGYNQSVYTTLGTYQASDTTLLNLGWNITFQATRFTCTPGIGSCPAGGNSLPLNSLLMAPPTVACASGTSCTLTSAPPSLIFRTL